MRRFTISLVTAVVFGIFAQAASASSGTVAFAGGTARAQATVRSALAASTFDWSLLPRTITVHIGSFGDSYSTPGDVYVDAKLLDSGKFAWGVVQHEFGHQVDFFLLDDTKRALLQQALGAKDWCYGVPGLAHSDYGCERFASELSWAYWQSPDNSMQPADCGGESGAMPAASFRALLAELIGAPTSAAPAQTKAYAPKTTATKPKARRKKR
jgi:hypothetical protein